MAALDPRPLRDVIGLHQRLLAHDQHRDAEIVRALIATYRASRQINALLHADNMALRKGLPSGGTAELDYPARARAKIAEVHASLPEAATYEQRVRALKQAYPFGERRYWPYQAWLTARRAYLRQYDPATPEGPLFAPQTASARGFERLANRPLATATVVPALCPHTAPLPFLESAAT
jgi:hypothetical protein